MKKQIKNFNPKAEGHRKLIRARWNEGYKLEDFKKSLITKTSQWLGRKALMETTRSIFKTKHVIFHKTF